MRITCFATLLASAAAFTAQIPSFDTNPIASRTTCAATVEDRDTEVLTAMRTLLAPCGSIRPVVETTKESNAQPNKPRVLFLHGEYTNERVAEFALKLNRWDKLFDFVIPGATNDGSVCPPELFDSLGLGALEKNGRYSKDDQFWTWGCRYDLMKKNPFEIPEDLKKEFQRSTAEYIKQIDEAYGPFDGVMGFCEGGAALNCALGMKQDGQLDGALDSVKFFIHMAPWASPLGGKYQSMKKSIPTLSIYGANEPIDGFPEAAAAYPSVFNGYFDEYVHNGQHDYARVTSDLRDKVTNLLEKAEEDHAEKESAKIQITQISQSDDCGERDAKILEIFEDVLDTEISAEMSLVDDLDVDSIYLWEFVNSLEDEFGITIDADVEERLNKPENTVQDVVDIVAELL